MNRLDWIMDWLGQSGNLEASVVNEPFMEAYHRQFPKYKRQAKMWGAQPVAQALRDLRTLQLQGRVERCKINLGMSDPGFPKWVWSYRLSTGEVA